MEALLLAAALALAGPIPALAQYDEDGQTRDHEDVDWTIQRVRGDWMITRASFFRLIAQGSQLRWGMQGEDYTSRAYDFNVLYGWEFSPGSMFYLAYNQPMQRVDGENDFLDPTVVAKVVENSIFTSAPSSLNFTAFERRLSRARVIQRRSQEARGMLGGESTAALMPRARNSSAIDAKRFAWLLPTIRTVDVEQFCSWSACRISNRSMARFTVGSTS